MEEKIIALLREINEEIPIDTDLDLLSAGIIDSFDIANIVASIEEEFGIELSAEDIVPENFSTIGEISELIKKYVKGGK